MSKTLSYSQLNTYLACGEKYRLHYNERLRETVTSAALLFGSALDQTVNEMLLDKKKNQLKTISYYQTKVRSNWQTQPINRNPEDLPESLLIAYADQDHDYDLLTNSDIAVLYDRAKTLISAELMSEKESVVTPLVNNGQLDLSNSRLQGSNKRESLREAYGKLAAIKKHIGIENINEDTARYLNLENWHVMLRKGELMITAIYEKVLPQIKEVVEVQKRVELVNDKGDSTVGFIDAVLIFEGEDFPRISDLKTSARAYEQDAANVSPQLAGYGFSLGITKSAFIVLSKAIKKNKSKVCAVCGHNGSGGRAQTCDNGGKGKDRCGGAWIEQIQPEAQVEIIKGDINPIFEENVIANYEHVLKAIEAEIFPRNFNSCMDFGRKCQFYSICHEGKTSKNLVKV